MSHLNSRFLSAYNSLADKHLTGYFNNTRIRRHLLRAGLITRSGSIVPEKDYRLRLLRRDHQRRIRECLTQAIFHKVLDIERHHKIEIKRKLEDFARKEHVHKIKVQRSKRHNKGTVPPISPKPPSGPRNEHPRHSGTDGEQSESSISPCSSLPSSAPGMRMRPVRLRPLYSNSTTASTQRPSRYCRSKDSSDDAEPYLCGSRPTPTTAGGGRKPWHVIPPTHVTNGPLLLIMLHQHHQAYPTCRETRRHVTMPEFSSGISPYRLPVINNYVTPVPPPAKRNERSSKGATSGRTRGRSLRPTTAPNIPAVTKLDSRFHRTKVHSNVSVTMTFYGKAVHLTPDTVDTRDEVKVFQQHCGGENVCVYRGKLAEGEVFQFVSRRHLGFPFSLTFFLNGMLVERLSSCCEFRHQRGSRLGGKRGLFGFAVVDGASPCYKCIIALGLDKKPIPPPKRLQRDTGTPAIASRSKTEDTRQHTQSHSGQTFSLGQADRNTLDTETQEDHPEGNEQKAQDDYEEDFEQEDERVDEEAGEMRASAVLNGMSSCPSEEGGDGHHKREDDEQCGCSDSQVEEEKAEVKKKSASVCSGSVSPFSSSRKEDPDSEAEEVKEAIKDSGVDPYTKSDCPTELWRKGETVQDLKTGLGGDTNSPAHREKPTEKEYLDIGATGRMIDQPNTCPTLTAELRSEMHKVHGNDTSETSLEESEVSMPPQEKEATKLSMAEPEKDIAQTVTRGAKSMQEKLTAAITKETHISSELEMSDSSSDDEPPTTDTDRTPDLDQANTGVEAVAVAEKWNAEEKPTKSDGALNISIVDLTPQEGQLRTQEMREEEDQGTEEADPDVKGEESNLGDRDIQAQEPVDKGEGSEEEAQESGNCNAGTESQTNFTEIENVGATAGEGDWIDKVAEDSVALIEAPGLMLQEVDENKVREHELERWLKEGMESTASNEVTASILEEQDVKAEKTGEEEEMAEKANEAEVLVDPIVTVAEIRPQHSTETAEMSNAEEVIEAQQEITEVVNGEAEIMDGGKGSAVGEKEEETETTVETPKDEVGGGEGGEAQTVTGDIVSKTEISDDTSREKLNQVMEEYDKTDYFVNTWVNDDKEEVVWTMNADIGINEASAGESGPRAEVEVNKSESNPKTGVWQTKCDKMATMFEESEVVNITVEEPEKISWGNDATENENTEGVWESSAGTKDEGLRGGSKAAELLEESEVISSKEEEALRDTKLKADGLEIEIKEEIEVRYAEMGSTGEKIVETPAGEEPKSLIVKEQTIDQEMEWNVHSTEFNTPLEAQEDETQPEGKETLDMTDWMQLEIESTGTGTKNGDIIEPREVEEAVESSRAGVTVGTPGKVETEPMTTNHPDEHELWNEETEGLKMKWGKANPASDTAEKDSKTEAEVPVDGIDVGMGDTDMKEEEAQKIRAAGESEAGTKAEENEVNNDMKGLPGESPGNSNLQENTMVVKSDITGYVLSLKAESESQDQAKACKEIEGPDKETSGVDSDVCDIEGSEESWVNTDREEGSSNNTEIMGSETANSVELSISRKPGSAALEVEDTAAESSADVVQGRPEEKRKMGEEATPERKEGQDAAGQENTWNTEKSRVDSEHSVSRSKTELENRAKFPPPLVRRSRSYTLTIAREGLSFSASDRETESPLTYVQTPTAITGNAFTASNQKLQRLGTKDM